MTEYRYQTVDLKTNTLLADVDLQKVTFSIKLSGIGELSGELFCPEGAVGQILDESIVPGRTGLYVFRDGIPVWGGVIWKRYWVETNTSWRLLCKSWESYAYHFLQTLTKNYTNTDQLTIGRDLIDDLPVETYSGIEPPATATSGRLRDRNMFPYDGKSIGLELEQLAGLEDGFDYIVESYIKVDGSLGRRYVFGYPRLGRTASLTDPTSLAFDYPGNLLPFELEEDAENSAWHVLSIGEGEGSEMLTASAEDTDFDAAGWPRLDAVTQYKDVSIQATLQEHANEDLKSLLPLIESWVFQVSPKSDIKLSDISVGDSAIFRLRSRRWPAPKEFICRIVEITVTPGDGAEVEKIGLGLADEPA